MADVNAIRTAVRTALLEHPAGRTDPGGAGRSGSGDARNDVCADHWVPSDQDHFFRRGLPPSGSCPDRGPTTCAAVGEDDGREHPEIIRTGPTIQRTNGSVTCAVGEDGDGPRPEIIRVGPLRV